MIYQIAICDDSPADRAQLCALTQAWAQGTAADAALTEFVSAEAFMFAYEDHPSWDMVLFDIEMGAINGVELAKWLRKKDKNVQIIFVSGYSDYIADGYDVEALHYLMKPIDRKKLFAVLNRACEKLDANGRYLILETSAGSVRVYLRAIRYIDVCQNYTTIHADEDISVKQTLTVIEKQLDDSFFRIGRSACVNLHEIRKITKAEVQLFDGTLLPLPRGMYEPLNRALIRFF